MRARMDFLASGAGCALVLGALAYAPAARAADPSPPRGKLVRFRISSEALHDRNRSVRVYLPASYDTEAGRAKRYPVVYMLHGWPGGDGNWPGSGRADDTLDSLIARDRIPEVLAVMPDGNGIGLVGRSVYVNSANGASRMEDFIVHELPAWADSAFRTRREPGMRAIVGLSDGGFAAFNLAFRHPDVFGAAGSHSGYFRLTPDVSIAPVIGEGDAAAAIAKQNSPLDYLDRVKPALAKLTLYFDCGVGDSDIGSNREMDHDLTRMGIAHTYKEFPGGHGWGYWKSHLHESLIAVTAKMR